MTISGGMEVLKITEKQVESKIIALVNNQTFQYKAKVNSADENVEFLGNIMGKEHPSKGLLFANIKRKFPILPKEQIVDLVTNFLIGMMKNPPIIINP